MIQPVNFATGNPRKIAEARRVLDGFGIGVIAIDVQTNEIQHHDPRKVTEAKAQGAFEATNEPVVVNDSYWSIPVLGGFPGAYMKDVSQWFAPEDFLALMAQKSDKSIVLTEVIGYFDGRTYQDFRTDRPGTFISAPSGSGGNSLNKVVSMEGDNGSSIAEVLDKHESGEMPMTAGRAQHWRLFAEWYAQQ